MKKKRQDAGFTLTEVAIVLGVIVAIFAAIWAAASAAFTEKKIYAAAQRVSDIVTDIRMRYVNDRVRLTCTNASIVKKLLEDDVIDKGWVIKDANIIETAVGKMDVWTSQNGCAENYPLRFFVFLKDLTPEMCIKMLFSKIDYNDSSIGITQVCVGSWSSISSDCKEIKYDRSTGVWGPDGKHWTLQEVENLCGAGQGRAFRSVGWEFKLKN